MWHRGNADTRRIAKIPGVGVLTTTVVAAAMRDPAAYRSGGESTAWLGLVPRHNLSPKSPPRCASSQYVRL